MFVIPVIIIIIGCSVLTKIWWTGPVVFVGAILIVKYFSIALSYLLTKENIKETKKDVV